MELKSGKRHGRPHKCTRSPLVDRISVSATLARTIMDGSTMEKMGAILDLMKANKEGHTSDSETRRILAGALGDESRQVRWSAVYAFGQMDDLEGLLEGTDNECQVVRSMSVAMIYATLRKREMPDVYYPSELMQKVVRTMASNTGSEDRSVAIYSASALSEIAKRDPVSVIGVISEVREKTADTETLARLRGVEMAADEALTRISLKNRA